MALPPTIPTSFVPHAPGSPQQFRASFSSDSFIGAFGLFAYFVLGVAFVLALGVFVYGRYLASELSTKDAAIAKATAAIDRSTVEGFVRLRNRLNLGGTLLNKHLALSSFFTSLETLLPASVRFSALHISTDAAGMSKVEATGLAKNFNSLAVVSTAFAADGRIKDAIFSKISINKDNSVSFSLSATLDPKLVAFSPDGMALDLGSPSALPTEPVTQTAPPVPTTPSAPTAPSAPPAPTAPSAPAAQQSTQTTPPPPTLPPLPPL